VGVSKADQHLLFKKFSRVPNDLTNKVVGSGIGLYLAKKIAEGHSGLITFESEQNQGSEVTLTLPKKK
jgi:two-component system phosphate regulon sensor histidine kinase PhoR